MTKPSLKINALSNWATLFINIIVGFLLTPFVIKHLGKTGYGIWTLVTSLTGYYGLLNLGVGSAMTRYVARYAGQKDEESLNGVASTAVAMFCCTGMLVMIISFFIGGPLSKFFNVEPQNLTNFKYVIWIVGIVVGIGFPGNVYSSILRAHEKFVVYNISTIILTLVRSGLLVVVLLAGKGLMGLAITHLVTELVTLIVNILLCRVLIPSVRVNLSKAKWSFLRILLTYGSVTTVIAVADIMRGNIDSFVIGKWIDMPSVGVYGIAVTLTRYIINIITSGMNVLGPRFAALDGKGDHNELRRLLLKAMSVSSFLSFGGYMMAIVMGKQFILWWVGDEFSGSIMVLWILSACHIFALAQNPGIGLMYALNKHYLYAIATIIEAIANLTLSIILVQKYGIIGVALGTMIPMLIVKILVQPIYVSRLADISIREYIKPMIPSAAVASFIIGIAYFAGVITRNTGTIGYLTALGIITGLLYIVLWYLVIRLFEPEFLINLSSKR